MALPNNIRTDQVDFLRFATLARNRVVFCDALGQNVRKRLPNPRTFLVDGVQRRVGDIHNTFLYPASQTLWPQQQITTCPFCPVVRQTLQHDSLRMRQKQQIYY